MNVIVSKTAIDDLRNDMDNGTLTLVVVNHDLYIYGYLIIGPMLVLVNTPIFLLVMIRKAFRERYLVLAIIFLNGGLTGISAILMGMKRWIISAAEELYIAHYDCVLNVPIFLLSMFFLDGWGLLMNSAERLTVVAFPLFYYTHSKRIAYSLIVTQYAITIIAITFTAMESLIEPIRYVSHFCFRASLFISSIDRYDTTYDCITMLSCFA
uniref:G_PROTEIN_RECEP_F1_2 domain-containing protein n=1 Tax=Loa loa TaxID=7209 RepID=A0A1I7W1N0_LOALO